MLVEAVAGVELVEAQAKVLEVKAEAAVVAAGDEEKGGAGGRLEALHQVVDQV